MRKHIYPQTKSIKLSEIPKIQKINKFLLNAKYCRTKLYIWNLSNIFLKKCLKFTFSFNLGVPPAPKHSRLQSWRLKHVTYVVGPMSFCMVGGCDENMKLSKNESRGMKSDTHGNR